MEQTHRLEPIPADLQTHSHNTCLVWYAAELRGALLCSIIAAKADHPVYLVKNFYNFLNARTRHLDIVLCETSKEKPFLSGPSSLKPPFLLSMSPPSVAPDCLVSVIHCG